MAADAEWSRRSRRRPRRPDGRVFVQSFLEGSLDALAGSVDLIITSPPYLNNYHYNRNTRPQLYYVGAFPAYAPIASGESPIYVA